MLRQVYLFFLFPVIGKNQARTENLQLSSHYLSVTIHKLLCIKGRVGVRVHCTRVLKYIFSCTHNVLILVVLVNDCTRTPTQVHLKLDCTHKYILSTLPVHLKICMKKIFTLLSSWINYLWSDNWNSSNLST